ncbi:polyprotein [Panicum miliaceum]|uniref:Polyprotein n=1 Tax=Panicum miliaceum TaxID=4540 RepID=A0A3L6S8B0_PANMI|nr:polyprotein [Panicum miliaceum]
MAAKGSVQHWFASIPKSHIYSWSQLRSKLLTSFQGLKIEELTSCDFHNCKQGEKETLEEYMQRVIKL